MYPNVGAAGCGLVGAGGVLGLRPRGSRCALAARASPSQLALRAHGLRYALAARASPSQLARSRLVCTDLEKTKKETLYEFVLYNLYKNCRVVYRVGIFRSVSVGISRYLPYRYRRKTRSVFSVSKLWREPLKKLAGAPFFLRRGGLGPLFVGFALLLKKKREFFKKRVPANS